MLMLTLAGRSLEITAHLQIDLTSRLRFRVHLDQPLVAEACRSVSKPSSRFSSEEGRPVPVRAAEELPRDQSGLSRSESPLNQPEIPVSERSTQFH